MIKNYTEVALGTIADFSYGHTATAQDNGDIRFLRITDIDENGSLKKNGAKFIDFTIDLEKYKVKKGDLLVARTGGTFGKTLYYQNDESAVYASFLIKIILNTTRLIPEYYFHFSQSNKYWFQANNLVTGGGQPQFNANILKEIVVPLPPLSEQKDIADLLSTWDIAIEKTARLIEAKMLRHAELSNKLLNRNFRAVPLKTFLRTTLRAVSKPDKPYWALGIRSHGKGTFRRFVENPSAVAMDILYRVKHDDLIVNITFAWEGAIAFVGQSDEDCFVSHRFPTFEVDINKALPDYLRHVIVQKRFTRNLAMISPGGAGRNRVLNKKDFLNLRIALPEIIEQHQIGDILNTSLHEISLLQAKLELLKKQKRGLMQKLLTGQWRVKNG